MPLPLILDTLQLGRRGIIAATALETNEGIALFDTGPESTFENVIVDLGKAGFAPKDVRHVFLSHVHLDHAGAAWRFAKLGAIVYVHPRGARHLIDPTKLIESAARIFGHNMKKLWGDIAPVPSERVRILEDDEAICVPPFEIRAIETPGHANHHHIYLWDDNVFGGDVAGVHIGNGPPIPPFVPPDLHIESWLESIRKIRALNPVRLYLPHFGKVQFVESHLNGLEERVNRWSKWLRDKIRAGLSEQQLIPDFADYEHSDLLAWGATDDDVQGYEAADPSYMAVSASIRYWNKYHPDEITR